MTNIAALILAAGLVLATFVWGGRYVVSPVTRGTEHGYVFVVDRFTGAARSCVVTLCRELAVHPPGSN